MKWPAGLIWVLSATAVAAGGDHAPKVERGIDGLAAFAFEALNTGEAPIACTAAIAHWYSVDLGRAKRGQAVRRTLWFDPKRGAVFLMNKDDVRLPVESLWCGLEGRSWETRHVASLPNRAGEMPRPITLTCAGNNGRLVCH